jgi:hypothetical protein
VRFAVGGGFQVVVEMLADEGIVGGIPAASASGYQVEALEVLGGADVQRRVGPEAGEECVGREPVAPLEQDVAGLKLRLHRLDLRVTDERRAPDDARVADPRGNDGLYVVHRHVHVAADALDQPLPPRLGPIEVTRVDLLNRATDLSLDPTHALVVEYLLLSPRVAVNGEVRRHLLEHGRVAVVGDGVVDAVELAGADAAIAVRLVELAADGRLVAVGRDQPRCSRA